MAVVALAGAAWAAGKLYSIARQKGATRSFAIVAPESPRSPRTGRVHNAVVTLVTHLDQVIHESAILRLNVPCMRVLLTDDAAVQQVLGIHHTIERIDQYINCRASRRIDGYDDEASVYILYFIYTKFAAAEAECVNVIDRAVGGKAVELIQEYARRTWKRTFDPRIADELKSSDKPE